MTKKEFYKKIAEGYFDELSVSLDDFCEMLKGVYPVFGVLKTEMEDKENGYIEITFIDDDKADAVFSNNPDLEVDESLLDMSTVILKLTLSKEGVITTISHGIHLLTPVNKENILFLGSLINKKIIL